MTEMTNTFIVSTGRTATTSLVSWIERHDRNLLVRHEPQAKFHYDLGWKFWKGELSLEDTADSFLRQRKLWRGSKTTHIDVGWQMFNLIPAMARAFPYDNVIHIVRDGRDFVRSYLGHMNKISLTQNIYPHLPNNLRNAVRGADIFQWACNIWTWRNQIMDSALKTFVHKDRRMTVKLEDFPDITEDMFNFMDIDVPKLLINHNKHAKDDTIHYDDWSEHQKAYFYKYCGKTMRKFNYPTKSF